jgi:hypothetical protein
MSYYEYQALKARMPAHTPRVAATRDARSEYAANRQLIANRYQARKAVRK